MASLASTVIGCIVTSVCGMSQPQCESVAEVIVSLSTEMEMDPVPLVTMAAIESAFQPTAISSANAVGVMQITPITEKHVNKLYALNLDRTNPVDNLKIGILYWRTLGELFNRNTTNMVAAYNAGPTRVRDFITRKRPLPSETVNHIRKFKAVQNHCEACVWNN